MITQNLNTYSITINHNTQSSSFPYKELGFQDIVLNNYYELPQNVKWTMPRMSQNKQYIGAKAIHENGNESVYIWSALKNNFGNKYLYEYTSSDKILFFEFINISTSFIIIYQSKPPVLYDIKTGNVIHELETNNNMNITNCLSWSFSPGGRFYALCTDDHFYVWDIVTSKLKIHFEEHSPKKFIRNDLLITINKDNVLYLRNITKERKDMKMRLQNIKSPFDILNCSLSEDNQFLYYATKESVTQIDLKAKDFDEVMFFNEIEPDLIYMSYDCQKYLLTNRSEVVIWEIGRGQIFSKTFQMFNDVNISFANGLMMYIDNISIILQDIDYKSKDKNEITLFKVFTDKNPISFKHIQYTYHSQFVLCWIDHQSAALYNCSTGDLVHKWVNHVDHWERALQLAPISAVPTILATKTTNDVIQVWDYSNGICICTLTGFNAYDIKFNAAGNLLAAGTVQSNEIARIWDIDYPLQPYSFKTDKSKLNKQTVVYITDDKKYLICHAQFQNPFVFNTYNCQFILECEYETKFSYIENIFYSDISKMFISYGISMTNQKIGCYWAIESGKCIKELNDCKYVEMSVNEYSFVNVYDNKVGIMYTKGDKTNDSYELNEDNAVAYNIINDSKGLSRKYEEENNRKTIRIVTTDIITGELLADLTYKQLNDENIIELDMVVDNENNLNLRRLKFKQEQ